MNRTKIKKLRGKSNYWLIRKVIQLEQDLEYRNQELKVVKEAIK